MSKNPEFVVWKRNDGYVGCTTGMPNGWETSDGRVSFIHLKTFYKWDSEVIEYINNQRLT